jgi:hypothetical protein
MRQVKNGHRLALVVAAIVLGVAPTAHATEVLATGDSMIGLVGDLLRSDYTPAGVNVDEDSHPGTGITKPFLLNWEGYAKRQVDAFNPDVVVMALGANDGLRLGGIACCRRLWVKKYAKHVNRMITSYTKDGTTTLYWMLLPAPRPPRPLIRRFYLAVNDGVRRAVRKRTDVAHLVNVSKIVSPGFHYRERIHGTSVRADDGIHLSVDGARLVVDDIEQQMEDDGVLTAPSDPGGE